MLLLSKLLMLAVAVAMGTSVTVFVYLILKQYPHYIVHCTRFVCAFPTYWMVLSYTKLNSSRLHSRNIAKFALHLL